MTAPGSGTLYFGSVMHRRSGDLAHHFRYRVFSVLLDIDAIPHLAARSRMFGYNRRRPIAFYDRDHGPRDGSGLRPWVENHLRRGGLDRVVGGRIRLLCFPRLWGYAFNPLSVYFCDAPDGRLAAILYEVSNTFGEQHGYLLPVTDGGRIDQRCAKSFYVSPFIAPEGEYRFRVQPPDGRLTVAIHQSDSRGQRLIAVLTGHAAPFDDRTLLRALAAYPLMTVKVIAAIHWQALKLWLKGAPFYRHIPAPVIGDVSYASAETRSAS